MSEINCPHCGGKFHCGMVDTGYIGHVPVIIIANDDITLHSAVNLMTEHEMIHKEVIARNDLSTEMHRSMRKPLPEPIRWEDFDKNKPGKNYDKFVPDPIGKQRRKKR